METVIEQDAPLEGVPQPVSGRAMVNLNMIDTQGGGIKRMFMKQRQQFSHTRLRLVAARTGGPDGARAHSGTSVTPAC